MKNLDGAKDHLNNHQKYPATKGELMAECDGLSDFSAEDKKWFGEHLTEKTYTSAQDVMETLGLS